MTLPPPSLSALHGLLCAALLCAVATGDAQARTDTAQPAADQTALRLTQALGTCFADPDGIDADTTVTLRFRLLDDGKLGGVPRRVGNVNRTGDEQKLYFHGLQTLYDCVPLPINDAGGEFDVVMTATGVDRLYASQDAPPPVETVATDPAPATAETEAALGLDRTARRELQLRLRLIGFDPRGVDGVFGPNTRSAISTWQETAGFAASGYLDATQLEDLRAQSEAEFAAYEPPRARTTPTRQRVRVRICRKTGILGIKFCRYEYR
ncbi:peptidoglycan-binding domain-containing protein [Roseovarius aestuariivivens]|uniref:peptidoglycan-binding domain-containing protein n=1 Tax=Roseovarius aestuariivivens TaxID=1888910 RepID=UPI001080FAB2|nr:peptidoglycan-binding domain-containing protein [Roseovarius aestuariivivens]